MFRSAQKLLLFFQPSKISNTKAKKKNVFKFNLSLFKFRALHKRYIRLDPQLTNLAKATFTSNTLEYTRRNTTVMLYSTIPSTAAASGFGNNIKKNSFSNSNCERSVVAVVVALKWPIFSRMETFYLPPMLFSQKWIYAN